LANRRHTAPIEEAEHAALYEPAELRLARPRMYWAMPKRLTQRGLGIADGLYRKTNALKEYLFFLTITE
jgi:hypothetical protein